MTDRGLRTLFFLADRAPWVLSAMRPVVKFGMPRLFPTLREAVESNARRIFDGPPPPDFAGRVIADFYDFVRNVAGARRETLEHLQHRVSSVDGRDAYLATRAAAARGCVLVTAHLGSFEAGLAELRRIEPRVHVVFKRDAYAGFEALRNELHRTLGVHDAAIDDGWPTLFALRDALRDNAVVVMQGDRVMPGQKSVVVPFLGGRLRVPLGPVKLAQAVDCPVVPAFTVREPDGRFRVCLEPAIDPHDIDAPQQIADSIARFVRWYPDQWLVLHRAFVEDEPA